MMEGREKQEVIKDYISIMFRYKNEIYHHKAVNKILYYDYKFKGDYNKEKKNKNIFLNSNNNLFFTGSCDSIIKLWINDNSNNLNLISNFEHHSNWITSLTLYKKQNILISSSNDQSICIWDLNFLNENKENLKDKTIFPKCNYPNFHNDYISCLQFNENTKLLYSSGYDGKIYSLNFDNIKITNKNEIFSNESSIYSLDLCENENILAVSLYNENKIILLDLKTNKEIFTLHGHNDIIRNLKISPDGKYLISISSDKTIKFWDVSKQKFIYNFDYHKSGVCSLYINKYFNKMITGSIDGDIFINDFDLKNFALFDNINDSVLDIQMNEEENQIISSCRNGKLYLYDLLEKKENNIYSDSFIGKIKLNKENEYKKICDITKDEISEFKLMNNKIYVILKYQSNEDKGEVINLLRTKRDKNSKKSSFKTLDNKLHEVDRNNLESWCSLDINTGFLKMTLYEDKCFNNDISKINLNFIEKIIEKNFSIYSDSQLFIDKPNKNKFSKTINLNNDTYFNMQKNSNYEKIYNNTNVIIKTFNKRNINIKSTFGSFVIKNIIENILENKLIEFSKIYFENGENKIIEEYEDLFKKNENKEDIDDLFIKVSKKGKSYSFYLNNINKMIFPHFCFRFFESYVYKLFKSVNLIPFDSKDNFNISININVENVSHFLKEDKKYSLTIDKNYTFKKLFDNIKTKLDENKIKKIFSKEMKNNKLSNKEIEYINNTYLKSNNHMIKLFYLSSKSNIKLNKKNCESIEIAYIILVLNKGNLDFYTFKLLCSDIKSLISI